MSLPSPCPCSSTRTGLHEAEVARYRAFGYVAVPGFFTAEEVAALQAETAGLQAAGKLSNVATDGDGRTASATRANLQICPVGSHSRLIRSLPYCAKVASALASLVPGEVVQQLDQIFLKPAHHGVGTNWHTDNAYFGIPDATRGVGMWIAVHDATIANGTMRVVPGSHRRAWEHRRDPGSNHHITCADAIGDAEVVPVELAAGGVLFFNYGIAHSTGANGTERDRAGLALHFLGADQITAASPWFNGSDAGVPRNWRFLTGPRTDGGIAAWGEDLRGVFDDLCRPRRAA